MEKKILIVEDDPVSAKILESNLAAGGYIVDTASNGAEALEKFARTPYLIVITDIEMPVMNGEELLGRLMAFDNAPLVFVETVHSEIPLVIDIMKKGAYDYLIKPVDTGELLIKVQRACDAAEMIRMKKIIEKEKVIRLENQLEWVKWKERAGADKEMRHKDRTLFHSIQTSFNQGQGFGALITLLDIVSASARRDENSYVIDASLMDVINANVKMARNALESFKEIDWLIANELPLTELSCDAAYDLLVSICNDAEGFAGIAGQKIIVSEKKSFFGGYAVRINHEHLRRAVFEVLMNACKFSEKKSDIIVMVAVVNDRLEFSCVSRPFPNEEGVLGIPMEYEYILFEPFFRMTKMVYEGYNTLDFGLGLTIVEKIIQRHRGKITISNIIDYSDITRGPVTKVNCVISIPVSRL